MNKRQGDSEKAREKNKKLLISLGEKCQKVTDFFKHTIKTTAISGNF